MRTWLRFWRPRFGRIDWLLLIAALPLVGAGLITMNSFGGAGYFFDRQLIWTAVGLAAFFIFSQIDWRFLRRSGVLMTLFIFSCLALLALQFFGSTLKGAQSWFAFGVATIQPVDFIKLVLILILAKYFSRRHIEIAHFRHILVSGVYALGPFVLVFLQPDFGSAIIIFLLWLGLVMCAGISKQHLLLVGLVGVWSFLLLWFFVFAPYQRQRIITFVNPLTDIQGAGYSSFQSTVAIGSGLAWGKGVGYGTQSRLRFLPEYQTDFIFAAFAEEWGLFGVLLLFLLFSLVIWRILATAKRGETNFETLFGIGLVVWLVSHFGIGVGMNLGILPVTGLPIPFMSYGGSHLLAEFIGLGLLMGMRRYSRPAHRDEARSEFIGPV